MSKGIRFLGIGQSLPDNVLTNKELESITPGSSASWIEEKLGIEERRISTIDSVVSLGTASAREALLDSGLLEDDIDLIVVNTSSSDKLSPSVSCMIQNKLELSCPAFDINAVCSGFIYALDLGSLLLDKYKNILIISTETYSKITDWNYRNSCFFGDGSAALIITRNNRVPKGTLIFPYINIYYFILLILPYKIYIQFIYDLSTIYILDMMLSLSRAPSGALISNNSIYSI